MSLRLYGTISGCGRAAGTVIPSLGSGRYAPGPNIGLSSWLKGEDPNYTINVCWGQPGILAIVSKNIRRALTRMKRREALVRRDVNHCISKTLVGTAKDTPRGLAMEDLGG